MTDPAHLPGKTKRSVTFGDSKRSRLIDRIDQPARPLGAKRASLMLQRMQNVRPASRRKRAALDAGATTLSSPSYSVCFTLRTTRLGLVVERLQQKPAGNQLQQAMVFTELPAFERWCTTDPMRFEEPQLFGDLYRHGHAALSAGQ